MSGWVATTSVPPSWSETCAGSDALFHSEEWQTLLEQSLSCGSLYFLDGGGHKGAAMTLFRAGPFRLGYLGFPVGGMVGDGSQGAEIAEVLQCADVDDMPVAVRIPVSGFGEGVDLDLPYEATAETAIVNLQSWSLDSATKNRRRDVSKSLCSGLELVDATDPADAERIYELYRKTLERHSGSLRYNTAYFRSLIELASEHPGLRVLLARASDSIAAFNVVALDGSMGYYLHGAIDWSSRALRPSAMLMNEAIEWARADGRKSFSFLSSPIQQESLVRYKEGWGATTREHRTYTMPVGPTFQLFRIAERLYRLVR